MRVESPFGGMGCVICCIFRTQWGSRSRYIRLAGYPCIFRLSDTTSGLCILPTETAVEHRIFSSQPYMAVLYVVAVIKLTLCGDPGPSNTSKTGVLLLLR